MKWFRIDNTTRQQPITGTWSDWKSQIAAACKSQCVYCAIHEGRYGGIDNYHVEHFRPKSKYANLTNAIGNLYLACAICNRFKSNDWPGEPTRMLNRVAYPDPGEHDYESLFYRDSKTFRVVGNTTATKYVVERIYLNRPQLLRERRLWCVTSAVHTKMQSITDLLGKLEKVVHDSRIAPLIIEIGKVQANLAKSLCDGLYSVPYAQQEIRRPEIKRLAKRKKKAP